LAGYTFGVVELILMGVNVLLSILAFNDKKLFNRLSLQVGPVLQNKEWHRLLSSGFIHVSGAHLFFNMLSLFFFAGVVEAEIGSLSFAFLYLLSLVGGNILSVYLHRTNPNYRAVGASGAVSGIVFIAIALFPGMTLGLLFIPIPMPAWLFGVGFIVYSIYGIRKQHDNIGHEAHMGGAVCGLLGVLLLYPALLTYNTLTILLIGIPCLLFVLAVLFFQSVLFQKPTFDVGYKSVDVEDDYLEQKEEQRRELNRILDKMQAHGYESLTKEEQAFLKHFS
jgi:membrane associated rhomboid family serine protease